MKVLNKNTPFYQTVLTHFKKQYKDVTEVTVIKITTDNKICAGEWLDSKGNICISDSVDAVKSVKVI